MFNSSRRFVSFVLALVLMITSIVVIPGTTVFAAEGDVYTKVTDASTLKAGDKIVIVASNAGKAISTTQNDNNRSATDVTKNNTNNTVILSDSVQIFTLETGKVSGTFALNTGSGYLYAASSSKNYLRTEKTMSDNSSWKITINNSGIATIAAQGSNSRNLIKYNYNNNKPIFSAYASGQVDVCVYKLDVTEEVCNHNNKTIEEVTPGCTTGGYKTVTCKDCNITISDETFLPTGHNYVDGVCTGCGKVNNNVIFDLGAKGATGHNDGTGLNNGKVRTYTSAGYSLAVTAISAIYPDARDVSGDKCIKMGSSSNTGSLSFTVPTDVIEVVINIAGYKANNAYVKVNGTAYDITAHSNDCTYDAIVVDTRDTKTITVETAKKTGADIRAMMTSVEFVPCNHTYGSDGFCSVCGSEQPAVNIGGTGYDSFDEAIGAAQDGDTILLNKDVVYSSELGILNAVKIDLNGHTLTANAVALFASNASIVDSGATKGLVAVPKGYLAMSNSTGSMLPIWSEADGGYVFVDVEAKNLPTEIDEDSFKIVFRPEFDLASNAADFFKDGAENNGISIIVRINCIKDGAVAQSLSFLAPETNVQSIYTNNKALAFTVNGADDSFDSYEVVVVLQSDTGMEISEVIGSFAGGVYSNAN